MKKVPQTDCITCKHNEPFLNKKCVGCTNYINSNKTSVLKWEAKETETKVREKLK